MKFDLLSFHANPKTIERYDKVHGNVPEYIWHNNKNDHEKLKANSKKLMRDPIIAVRYAEKVLKGPWPEAEDIISKNPMAAVKYAKLIGKRWQKGEKAIATDIDASLEYAQYVLKDRFIPGEEVIVTNLELAFYYMSQFKSDFSTSRWPALEKAILNPRTEESEYHRAQWAAIYADNNIKGRWPEAESLIAKFASSSYHYAVDVLKGPFPKGEHAIRNNIGVNKEELVNREVEWDAGYFTNVKATDYGRDYDEFIRSLNK